MAAAVPEPRTTRMLAVSALLADLESEITTALGGNLVGLYLYGSLVTGDFDELISDIDLIAVTAETLDTEEFRRLDTVHRRVVERHPAWSDRIEVAYLSANALATFREARSPIAVISPGEPFNLKDAGHDWLINWYIIRNQGVALVGPPPTELITEITPYELVEAVGAQMQEWRDWVHSADHQGSQAYAILTACRGLYTYENATIRSKLESAEWAKTRLPHWAGLIDHAIELRKLGGHAGEADKAETVRFVQAVADEIASTR